MKKSPFIALGLGLLLASCGHMPDTPAAPPATTGQNLTQVPNPERARSAGELAPIVNEGQEDAIPGQYIVVLSEDAAGSALSAQSAQGILTSLGLTSEGIQIQNIYSQALHGFSAQLSAQALEQLRANPKVKYIEHDFKVQATATQSSPPSWGLDRADQRDLPLNSSYTYNYTGQGVLSYILDTGININHQQFGNRAVWGTNTTGDGEDRDCGGHGTHVAGTVGGQTTGIAKNTTLVAVKVLNCEGVGSSSGIIAGMDWAANNGTGRKVLNMSLGPKVRSTSVAYTEAVNRLYNKNILVVAAAGNSNDDACYYSPADAPNAITVASSDRYDRRSSFSNYGSCVDIIAPGSDIYSAWPTSNTAYNTISGTSMAAPHTTGAVALLLEQFPNETAAQITSRLLNNTTANKITDTKGSPNRLLYTLTGGTTAPAPAPAPETRTYTGTVNQGYSLYAPSTSGETRSGLITLELQGPSGTDFDLYLQRWNGSSWVDVVTSETTGSYEKISTNVTSGTYRYEVYAYSGSGSFTLTVQ